MNIPDATFEGYSDADIRIEPPHPAYGENRPFTTQPGGCGQQGTSITIPPAFLNQQTHENKGNPRELK